MLVYTRTPRRRASRVFGKLAQATSFTEGLAGSNKFGIRRTAYTEPTARWAVNYLGAGKGSHRDRTKAESRIRVLYDEDGNVMGGERMVMAKSISRGKREGLVVGKRAQWMEPD